MDDLIVTTSTHIHNRCVSASVEDIVTWAHKKFKSKKSTFLVLKKGWITSALVLVIEKFKVAKCRLVMTLQESCDHKTYAQTWLGCKWSAVT